VAGRKVPAFYNGMATGADWMSAASFIGMAGTLFLLGYDGLAFVLGWTGGYVLVAILIGAVPAQVRRLSRCPTSSRRATAATSPASAR
jgi:Na+(H+)/acetate symporter ActP